MNDQPFYVCGPAPFNDAIMSYLKELGADPEHWSLKNK